MKFQLFVVAASFVSVPSMSTGKYTAIESASVSFDYESSAKLEDIERCLMDLTGSVMPTVYRQPDRVDEAMVLWIGDGEVYSRVDLKRTSSGTQIRAWRRNDKTKSCAPQK